jgi:phenylpyruvate tautomerase PptA (4-oxalocrotonate tautomerase family)
MPDVDIICLQLPLDRNDHFRTILTKEITEVFTEALGCSADAVTLRFHEMSDGLYAVGGKILTTFNKASKPAQSFQINVAWYAGKPPEMQDKVAENLTKVVLNILPFIQPNIQPENVVIGFTEMHMNNTYEGGKRIAVPPSPPKI